MSLYNFNQAEFGPSRADERRHRISILLTILALGALTHSILYARLEIGYWGLINGLPVTFFVALTLLMVASALLWFSEGKYTKLLGLQVLVIVLSLAMVPVITGGSISFINHGYRNLGYVEYIVRQGHFDTDVTFYLSWPGAFVLSAVISSLCQIDFTPLVEILPTFLPIITILPLYVFLRNTLGELRSKYVLVGCLIFFLAGGGGAGNIISAMGSGTMLLLVVLALVTNSRIWHREDDALSVLVLVIFVFTAMVICHLLTSLAALAIIAALALARKDMRLVLTSVGCLTVLLAWNLTIAGNYVIPRLPFVGEIGLIFDIDLLSQREITGHLFGSGSHVAISIARIVQAALFLLLGVAGFISSLVVKRDLRATISLAAVTLIPVPLAILSGYYAEEILTRIYVYIMPGIAYFGVRLFDINKRIIAVVICLLLLAAIPMKLMSAYGNQEIDYFSTGQRDGLVFFHEESSQGMVIGGWPMGEFKNIENYVNLNLDNLEWYDVRLAIPPGLWPDERIYIAISRQNRAQYEWYLGNTDFIEEIESRLQETVNYDRIYYNPDLEIYVTEMSGEVTD
jgi:hypothetical protein